MAVPAVSVVVSTRNRARYLPEALRTLAAQDSPVPFEVIVIDNGSTDDTPGILDEWCRRDSRFRSGREPIAGLSRGKNAGIRMALAPLLLFTDDDVRVDRRWVASYHDLFSQGVESGLMIAGGPIVPIPHDLGAWPPWLDDAALSDAGLLDYRERRSLRTFEYVWGGNMAVPRRIFDELGSWDQHAGIQGEVKVAAEDSEFFEDTELQDRVRRAGGATWFCPEAVVYHRVDRESVTPRRILDTAFARGRNYFWHAEPGAQSATDDAAGWDIAKGVLALSEAFIRLALSLFLFRLVRRKSLFERARRSAFRSGFHLDSLRSVSRSGRIFFLAARLAFAARDALLRLAPNVP